MFTGIVTHKGEVKKVTRRAGALDVRIATPLSRQLKVGDSIGVNGVCLTTTETGRRSFDAHVMAETLAVTTLGDLTRGAVVNLELPARLTDRMGGHLVQGHVDGRARVTRVEEDHTARYVWLAAAEEIIDHLAPRGSIALDGVSLTVADVGASTFQVALIPHTLANTTLAALREGTMVNVEVDMIAKYVRRFTERK